MVSIFSDGLRSVRPGWLEGSLALGVNRWRTIWKIARAHGPPGDRRRHRARGGPSDRRVGDAGDGLRLGRLRAQPRRRPDLHLRALASAGADDRQEHRPAELQAGERDPVRDRRRPALLGCLFLAAPAGPRGGRWANTGQPPDGGHHSPQRWRRPSAAASSRSRRDPAAGAVEGSATWRLSDRIGLAICWALGLLFCAIAAAIVVYLLIKGLKLPEALDAGHPGCLRASPKARPAASPTPYFGTLIVAVMGIAIALHRSGSESRSGWSSTVGPGHSPGSPNRRSRRSPASPRSCSPCSAP